MKNNKYQLFILALVLIACSVAPDVYAAGGDFANTLAAAIPNTGDLILASCAVTMADIGPACARSTVDGITTETTIMLEADVTSIPAVTADTTIVPTDFVMESTKRMWTFKHDTVDGELTSAEEGEGQSKYFVNTLTFFVPGSHPDIDVLLSGLSGGDVIALPKQKAHTNPVIIGDKGDAAVLSVSKSSGKAGYTVTVVWNSSHLPYTYDGAILLTPAA